MDQLIILLKGSAVLGALFCVGAYVYGYVLRPKGTRRLHVASLLFSGLALFSVIGLLLLNPDLPHLKRKQTHARHHRRDDGQFDRGGAPAVPQQR